MLSQYDGLVFVNVYLSLSDSNEQSMRQEIKSMVVSMLKNLSQIYYSHNSNIKYVYSTIKYIDFK